MLHIASACKCEASLAFLFSSDTHFLRFLRFSAYTALEKVFLGTLSQVVSPTLHSHPDDNVTTSRPHTVVITVPAPKSWMEPASVGCLACMIGALMGLEHGSDNVVGDIA